MKKIVIETGRYDNDYQPFRKACLEVIDEDIEICYNNNILKHNFNYKNKLSKTYKYHATKHEGALSKIEAEIFDIYSIMIKGGISTRVGAEEIFNTVHNYKINYAESDNMLGLKNVKIKTIGRQLCTTTYSVDCPVCGRKNVSSVKMDMVAKCHRCANKGSDFPQIKMSELVDLCEVTMNEDRTISFVGEDIDATLELDKAQLKTIDMLMIDNIKEKLKILYSLENRAIDINKMPEAPRPVSAVVNKPTTSTKKTRSKITDDDLVFVLNKIRENFANKSFKSRDLAPKVSEKFTARQLPSRLTQLVNKGVLKADDSSPKNYSLLSEK